jgi:hypothetical protein
MNDRSWPKADAGRGKSAGLIRMFTYDPIQSLSFS